jgi:hypothetical protein
MIDLDILAPYSLLNSNCILNKGLRYRGNWSWVKALLSEYSQYVGQLPPVSKASTYLLLTVLNGFQEPFFKGQFS